MHPAYFPVFFWSILIFVSFWGYGELLRRRLDRPEFADLGWGLTAAWGMSVVLAIGGVLMALHLARAANLTVVVLVGAAFAVYYTANGRWRIADGKSRNLKSKESKATRPPSGFRRQLSASSISTIFLCALALLAFASSIAWPNHIDPNDDLVCYLMLPEKILATGTLIEPFSFQRAGTFGGQSLLQALVMIVGGERNGHVPDRGFAMVILFGILLHATKGLTKQQAAVGFLLLFAFWFVPVPRISTNGAMVGACLLVGMLETWDRGVSSKNKAWVALVPVALLAAGACSIRPTFTVVVGFIFAALLVKDFIGSIRTKSHISSAVIPYFVTGAACFLILVPFMVVLFESNGTPMVPPISGYVSQAYQTYSFNNPWQDFFGVLTFCKTPESLCMFALLATAALFPAKNGTLWIIAATLSACAVILWKFSALAYLDQYRYIYPILVPISLWFLAATLQKSAGKTSLDGSLFPKLAPILTAAALVAILIVNASQGRLELRAQATGLPDQVAEVKPFFDPRLKMSYAHLQSLVPPGEKILTMVDASYWFDFQRNPIYSINAVGGSSPPPGIPFEKGSAALADYFKSLGIRYIIAVDFDNAVLLYTRKLWTERTRPEWFYPQIWRPRFLDFMSNIDSLEQSGRGLARSANARLIDLGYQ